MTCTGCRKAIGKHDYWFNTDSGPTCSAKCRDAVSGTVSKYANRRQTASGVTVNSKPGQN